LAAFRAEGFPTIDLGIVQDSAAVLKESMLEAVSRCDVVITSGGVSMGEADYVKTILQEIGTVSSLLYASPLTICCRRFTSGG
jgi:molybdopterin biosynthesis enzyme